MRTLTIVLADERIELPVATASALVDELWKGRVPGAAILAAKLAGALADGDARPGVVAPGVVGLGPSEAAPLRAALDALPRGGAS